MNDDLPPRASLKVARTDPADPAFRVRYLNSADLWSAPRLTQVVDVRHARMVYLSGQAPADAKTTRIASTSIPARAQPPRAASGACVTAAFVLSLSRAIVRPYNLNHHSRIPRTRTSRTVDQPMGLISQ